MVGVISTHEIIAVLTIPRRACPGFFTISGRRMPGS